jgi:hypothetical protein
VLSRMHCVAGGVAPGLVLNSRHLHALQAADSAAELRAMQPCCPKPAACSLPFTCEVWAQLLLLVAAWQVAQAAVLQGGVRDGQPARGRRGISIHSWPVRWWNAGWERRPRQGRRGTSPLSFLHILFDMGVACTRKCPSKP